MFELVVEVTKPIPIASSKLYFFINYIKCPDTAGFQELLARSIEATFKQQHMLFSVVQRTPYPAITGVGSCVTPFEGANPIAPKLKCNEFLPKIKRTGWDDVTILKRASPAVGTNQNSYIQNLKEAARIFVTSLETLMLVAQIPQWCPCSIQLSLLAFSPLTIFYLHPFLCLNIG